MANLGLESIDTSHLEWDRKDQSITSSDISARIELYKRVTSIIEKQDITVCRCYSQYNSTPQAQTCSEFFKIVNRIGSNSTQGEVYLVKFENVQAALKIMPELDNKSKQTNSNEIRIAKLMSDYVTSGKSVNFPLVYYTYHCNDVTYSLSSDFYNESGRYGIRKAICNFLSTNGADSRTIRVVNLTLSRITRSGTYSLDDYIRDIIPVTETLSIEPKLIKEINDKLTKFLSGQRDDTMVPVIECDILISELAQMDLTQFIQNHLEEGQIIPNLIWIDIFTQIIRGIQAMQLNNIIHNDLHPGNVLLNNGTMLIHDFGKSEIREHWEKNDLSIDIETLISRIISYQFGTTGGVKSAIDTMTPEFYKFLDKLHTFIEENQNDPELISKIIKRIVSEKKTFEGGRRHGRSRRISQKANKLNKRHHRRSVKRRQSKIK